MEQFLQVGIIANTHGIRGEVKVFPTTDDKARFKYLKKIIIDNKNEKISLEIQNVRFFKQQVILKFRGVDDINEIEKYKGCPLLINREDAVALEKDEYFIADLLGMQVLADTGEKGVLTDVLHTGANEVYAVEFENLGEVLLPAIRSCILQVDVDKGEMRVHILEGLI